MAEVKTPTAHEPTCKEYLQVRFEEVAELQADSVIRKFLITAADGKKYV
jgi:hypothetical protein